MARNMGPPNRLAFVEDELVICGHDDASPDIVSRGQIEGVCMNGISLPPVVGDVADILSLIGFFVTLFVAYQTRYIKNHFFSKVRLNEMLPELQREVELYISSLSEWQSTGKKELVIQRFHVVRGLLKNAQGKVRDKELREVKSLLDMMRIKRYLVFERSVAELSIDECWEVAGRMNTVVVMLSQRVKDLNWVGTV